MGDWLVSWLDVVGGCNGWSGGVDVCMDGWVDGIWMDMFLY